MLTFAENNKYRKLRNKVPCARAFGSKLTPAIFLDRDGVINKNTFDLYAESK